MAKTIVIGASGKKQSGKDTLCDGLFEWLETKFGQGCVKIYSYADVLKEKVCIEVLGLTREQCYGTDEQKNTLTQYKWSNFPEEVLRDNGKWDASENMTAREIMQVAGTDVFRKMFSDTIWVDATFRSIEKDGFHFALISDVRFPSEVTKIEEEDGYIFRLLRNVCEGDVHESENALDDFDWRSLKNGFVIDNEQMEIDEVTEHVANLLGFIRKGALA